MDMLAAMRINDHVVALLGKLFKLGAHNLHKSNPNAMSSLSCSIEVRIST